MKICKRFQATDGIWFYLIEGGIDKSIGRIEFYLNLFPFKYGTGAFHFNWSLEISWQMGYIHNFIGWL